MINIARAFHGAVMRRRNMKRIVMMFVACMVSCTAIDPAADPDRARRGAANCDAELDMGFVVLIRSYAAGAEVERCDLRLRVGDRQLEPYNCFGLAPREPFGTALFTYDHPQQNHEVVILSPDGGRLGPPQTVILDQRDCVAWNDTWWQGERYRLPTLRGFSVEVEP